MEYKLKLIVCDFPLYQTMFSVYLFRCRLSVSIKELLFALYTFTSKRKGYHEITQ